MIATVGASNLMTRQMSRQSSITAAIAGLVTLMTTRVTSSKSWYMILPGSYPSTEDKSSLNGVASVLLRAAMFAVVSVVTRYVCMVLVLVPLSPTTSRYTAMVAPAAGTLPPVTRIDARYCQDRSACTRDFTRLSDKPTGNVSAA